MIARTLLSLSFAVLVLINSSDGHAQTADQLRAQAERVSARIKQNQLTIDHMRADYNRIINGDFLPTVNYSMGVVLFGHEWYPSLLFEQKMLEYNMDEYGPVLSPDYFFGIEQRVRDLRSQRDVIMAGVRQQMEELERNQARMRDEHIALLDKVIASDFSSRQSQQVQSGSNSAGQADEAPDLSKSWSSNYGRIDFAAGWYGASQHPISAGAPSFDGSNYVVRGTWGDAGNESNTGGFEFVFSDSCSFTGTWWRDSSPDTIEAEPWNGHC